MAIRPATREDIPAIRSILAAHGNDGPVRTVDIVGPYVTHLVVHHRAMVSQSGDELVAFGAAVDAGVAVHLADLFVRPDLLGHGIGRPLLAAVFGDATRRTTFASDDPRALPLYVRAGMAPMWATLYVEGASPVLPPAPAGMELASAEPDELAALERAWTGVDRTIDHAFWASQAEADSFLVTEHDEVVAIAHARARQVSAVRVIDRMVVRPGADPVAPTLAALGRAGRGGAVMAAVMGPSPVLRALLDLGFQVTDRDQYMASESGLVDPARLVANPGML
ncbi:MAG: GNAT family N-acetyltransferase [Chloroflexota bacterium]